MKYSEILKCQCFTRAKNLREINEQGWQYQWSVLFSEHTLANDTLTAELWMIISDVWFQWANSSNVSLLVTIYTNYFNSQGIFSKNSCFHNEQKQETFENIPQELN